MFTKKNVGGSCHLVRRSLAALLHLYVKLKFLQDMTQGLKNLQESAAYKRTTENIQFAKEIAKEKTSGMVANITASGYFQVTSNEMSNYLPFCGWSIVY